MKCLNEHIARKANIEDKCTGHFWESRFKSQALLDETAVLSCMAYVDLNPVRAGMCDSPEESDYTSIQERLGLAPEVCDAGGIEDSDSKTDKGTQLQSELLPFSGNDHIHNNPKHLPFSLLEYFELVDWTGRQIREDKRGAISARLPPILQRLHIQTDQWLIASTGIEKHFGRAIGNRKQIHNYREHHEIQWLRHQRDCQQLYQT